MSTDAPVFGSQYMELTPQAEVVGESTVSDPIFKQVWDENKYSLPVSWQGDPAVMLGIYQLCAAYQAAGGTGLSAPIVTSISPTTAPANTDITLEVVGTGFDPFAKIIFGTAEISPIIVSDTDLVANVGAVALAQPGIISVSVKNSDGKTSNLVDFTAT